MASGNSKHRKNHKKKLAARKGKIAVAKKQYGKFMTMMQEQVAKDAQAKADGVSTDTSTTQTTKSLTE